MALCSYGDSGHGLLSLQRHVQIATVHVRAELPTMLHKRTDNAR